MKNIAQILAFKLSVLSTLMLCATANSYASDIEIYIPPGDDDKSAKVMFVLDVSTYMFQNPTNSSGNTIKSIIDDFDLGNGNNACGGPVGSDSNLKSHAESRYAGTDFAYTAYYCETPITGANAAIRNGCYLTLPVTPASPAITSGKYRCYDRLSTLKQSLTAVILNEKFWAAESAADGQKPKVSIGFSFFPLGKSDSGFGPIVAPVLLNAAGRDQLRKRISGLDFGTEMSSTRINSGLGLPFPTTNNDGQMAQVAQAYAKGVKTLIDSAATDTKPQCSGYGVYNLTAGIPDNDVIEVSGGARDILTATLDTATRSTNPLLKFEACGTSTSDSNSGVDSFKSWKCVEKSAELLFKKQNTLGVPIRTAVVSLGKSFSFYSDATGSGTGDFKPYVSSASATEQNPKTSLQMVEDKYLTLKPRNDQTDPVLENRRYAIRAGVAGDGGYYSVTNAKELQDNIERFLNEIPEVNFPYLTTGSPTVPQDPLNPTIVQDDAYYSQFKPTPMRVDTKGSPLWVGNLKKYNVTAANQLVGKSNATVLDNIGKFVASTHDLWAPLVTTTATDESPGSELYARMGGVKSQLPLGTTTTADGIIVENRKLFTNRVVTSGVAREGSSLTRIERKNYDTGGSAAGDPKAAEIKTLLDLRQLGAVMHSSPLLLSNQGKMTYNTTTKKWVGSNREDYVLFGSTQGLLHVVKADDSSTSGGGKEVFAFVPHEMIENKSKAFLAPEASTGGTANLFYGIDAPWAAYTEYVPKSDGTLTVGTGKSFTVDGTTTTLTGKQFVYGGLRMGGRSYYALDLGNMSAPTLKFHINPAAATAGTPLSYMGESWSKPKIAWIKWKGTRKLVMFVGGGYDRGYENDTYNPSIAAGAGVYMFSADGNDQGDLLWWASKNAVTTMAGTNPDKEVGLNNSSMQYSVVSEIKTADRNNDGLVDHIYFGDLGGQVFRVDFDNNAATSAGFAKRSTRLLNLNNGAESPRFYAAPSFAIFEDSATNKLFAAISIGSGNLSRPLLSYPSDSSRDYDALYTIYDKDVARDDLATAATMNTRDVGLNTTSTNNVLQLSEITTANRFGQTAASTASSQPLSPIASYTSSAGWYFKFKALNGTGVKQQEKVFYSPSVLDNDLYISTYDPTELNLRGDCGGGVKGVSTVRLFCMPFGQCSTARSTAFSNAGTEGDTKAIDSLGAGIVGHAIGGGESTRVLFNDPTNLKDEYKSPVKLIAQRWYER